MAPRKTALVEAKSALPDLQDRFAVPHPISRENLSIKSLVQEKGAHCRYLLTEVFPQIAPPPYGRLEIEQISAPKRVYLVTERKKNIEVVVKVFRQGAISLDEAWRFAEGEYFSLQLLRNELGMDSGDYRVVTPLGKNKFLLAILVTEKVPGELFDSCISKAVYEQQAKPLFKSLSSLAKFFVKLHRNGRSNKPVSRGLSQQYLTKLCDSLSDWLLSPCDRDTIEHLAGRWQNKEGVFSGDTEVVVHGDATPTNFFIHKDEVIAIDLERMKVADRCWDLGFIAAELKHHFMWRAADRWAAEPFIGHFLWEYAVNLKDSHSFQYLTRKMPLYMALGLLRIARNSWLDVPYRKQLIEEAIRCLEYGL
jgi:aminoglycoside phosphotransferase